MEGDNKYMADEFGLQNAKRGGIFYSFPSVLFIQLKRFEFDYATEAMTKVPFPFPSISAPFLLY